MGKYQKFVKAFTHDEATDEPIKKPAASRRSDDLPLRRPKWINRQRLLVFCSRNINPRVRHLVKGIVRMLPHAKTEPKIARKEITQYVNEICEMRNCQRVMYFENRKRGRDTYMWLGSVPHGPSAYFLVQAVHTMSELKLTGNCLKGSRPLLSFSEHFDKELSLQLIKEMFIQTFGTPNHHPRSQPFVDHVMLFAFADDRIFVRNYQILNESGELAEIGPRYVLTLAKIFRGNMSGQTLYTNSRYVNPNVWRRMQHHQEIEYRKQKLIDRQMLGKHKLPQSATFPEDEHADIFRTEADIESTSSESDSDLE